MRKLTLMTLLLTSGAALTGPAMAGEEAAEMDREATLYKNPQCGCCESYADHLRREGFEVTVESTGDMNSIKQRHGVPAQLSSCHTVLIDGYVVEGHVPLVTVDKLLSERPDIAGIALPGMPVGSPGMPGPKAEPFTIYGFSEADVEVFAVE